MVPHQVPTEDARVRITITWELEDPESDDADRLCPYLARADFRDVESRYVSAEGAVAHVKGAILHCLAEFRDPPTQITFIVLQKESP